MTAKRITARVVAWKHALAARLPAPMAAPETPQLRRWRIRLVVQLALLAVLTAAWEPIAATGLRLIAAIVWLALALASLVVGTCWLVAKLRADRAWLARERDK